MSLMLTMIINGVMPPQKIGQKRLFKQVLFVIALMFVRNNFVPETHIG